MSEGDKSEFIAIIPSCGNIFVGVCPSPCPVGTDQALLKAGGRGWGLSRVPPPRPGLIPQHGGESEPTSSRHVACPAAETESRKPQRTAFDRGFIGTFFITWPPRLGVSSLKSSFNS